MSDFVDLSSRRALPSITRRRVSFALLSSSLVSVSLASACAGEQVDRAGASPPQVQGGENVVVAPPYPSYSPGDAVDSAESEDGNTYAEWVENDWLDVVEEPLSTFSADVDTASYTIMRRALVEGRLPDPRAVRLEEMLNYFSYDEAAPPLGSPDAFAIHLEAGPSLFGGAGDARHLLRIGVAAEEVPLEERDPANLVFLIDVSGSMAGSDRLHLVKYALAQLVDKLSPDDTLGLVVYAGASGVVLEPTPVVEKSVILDALDALTAGGSTAGAAGIVDAYALAESAMKEDGINRVILCTDGDFNVGMTGAPLVELIEDYRERDIFFTILGFGTGNLNDALMEELTNAGNGNYAYIDTKSEALRVLGDHVVGTLQVVAKDVKLQVEFDPAVVSRYRLIGYENRLLEHDDFDDDTIDAGDMGAGHHMVALYELELREDAKGASPSVSSSTRLATLGVRHKKPTGDVSLLTEREIVLGDVRASLDDVSADYLWSMAVAELGEVLRESMHVDAADLSAVRAIADAHHQNDPSRLELVELIDRAVEVTP